jgi:hypothetical protein
VLTGSAQQFDFYHDPRLQKNRNGRLRSLEWRHGVPQSGNSTRTHCGNRLIAAVALAIAPSTESMMKADAALRAVPALWNSRPSFARERWHEQPRIRTGPGRPATRDAWARTGDCKLCLRCTSHRDDFQSRSRWDRRRRRDLAAGARTLAFSANRRNSGERCDAAHPLSFGFRQRLDLRARSASAEKRCHRVAHS